MTFVLGRRGNWACEVVEVVVWLGIGARRTVFVDRDFVVAQSSVQRKIVEARSGAGPVG